MGDSISDWEAKGFKLVDGKLVKINQSSGNSPKKTYNKYGNKKVVIDGITFDSTKEGNYYTNLKLRKKAGEIKDFKLQVPFKIEINGILITTYLLDFQVEHLDDTFEYIDIKAKDKKTQKWVTTDVFKLKKKLVEAIYKIEIKLV